MQTFEQTLVANVPAIFPGGRQFLLLESSSGVQVKIHNGKWGQPEIADDVEAIFKAKYDEPFDRVEVISTVGQTVKVGITSGESDLATLSGAVDANVVPGSDIETAADESVAATSTELVLAANADRKEAHISNLSSETLRWGDSTTGAAAGNPIYPMTTYIIDSSDAIYIYNPGAAAIDVALNEILK